MCEIPQPETTTVRKRAEKLREEVDSESKTRVYLGPWRTFLVGLSVLWVVFQLYFTTIGTMEAITLRAWHAMFLLVFCFILYPGTKKEKRIRKMPTVIDLILVATTIYVFSYLVLNYPRIALSGGFVTPFEDYLGLVAIVLVFLAANRSAGGLVWLAAAFLAYNFFGHWIPGTLGHAGFKISRLIGHMFWSSQGIFGAGIGVSATYIFVFVLFGSFLNHSGFSNFINNVSLTLVGRSPGGPAKVGVVASGLMGMINGSAIANVATTGSITIPMMRESGYDPNFSAALVAAAATGGQFCPPIMGAVAFLMAEFLGVSYSVVLLAAIIPAALYYIGLLFAVHLEARRLGLKGLAKEHIPSAWEVIKKEGHMVAPLVSLLAIMALGYTPLFACVLSIFVTIVASWLRPKTRMGLKKIIAACDEGARGAVSVGVCCVIIGIIVGTVSLTGLGLKFGYIMLRIVGPGELLKAGMMVALMSTILGMGVPGIAAYVIITAVAVPVMIEVGSAAIPAHMFCLIYASLSNITPPVAMSVYVASGIAKADFTKSGLLAVKVALAGFILPFFFLLNPVLLLGCAPAGTSIFTIIRTSLGAVVGIYFLAVSSQGWLLKKCSLVERLAALAIAFLSIDPRAITDIVGAVMAVSLLGYQYVAVQRERKQIALG